MQPQQYAIILFYNDLGEILLQFRDESQRSPHQWGTFGGKVDPGETLEEGLVREVREETGIELGEFEHLSTHLHPTDGDEMNLYTALFEGSPSDIVLGEGKGFGFFSLEYALTLNLTAGTRKNVEMFIEKMTT